MAYVTNTLTFDIETIPQLAPLSTIQQEELDRKLNDRLQREPHLDEKAERSKMMGCSPYFGEIVCIGLKATKGVKTDSKALIGTEVDILNQFWKILYSFNGLFISYNGKGFDVPFVLRRSMFHGIPVVNKSFMDIRKYQKYPHFDLQQVLSDFDYKNVVGLRLATELSGIPSPKEEGISAKEVEAAYHEGRIDDIAKYCLRDVEATYLLYLKAKDYTFTK